MAWVCEGLFRRISRSKSTCQDETFIVQRRLKGFGLSRHAVGTERRLAVKGFAHRRHVYGGGRCTVFIVGLVIRRTGTRAQRLAGCRLQGDIPAHECLSHRLLFAWVAGLRGMMLRAGLAGQQTSDGRNRTAGQPFAAPGVKMATLLYLASTCMEYQQTPRHTLGGVE